MSQDAKSRVIYSIFAFLSERNPLVLGSILSNAAHKDDIRYFYENWQYHKTLNLKEKQNEDSTDN